MLAVKSNTRKGGNWDVWISSRGSSTDETKCCALPLRSELETSSTGSVAKTATGTTVAATWIYTGASRDKSIKYNGAPLKDMLSGGIPLQTGQKNHFEVIILDVSVAKIIALETLKAGNAVDIIIKRRNSAEVLYLRTLGLVTNPDYPFDDDKADSILIVAEKTASGDNTVALVTTGFPTAVADVYVGSLDA